MLGDKAANERHCVAALRTPRCNLWATRRVASEWLGTVLVQGLSSRHPSEPASATPSWIRPPHNRLHFNHPRACARRPPIQCRASHFLQPRPELGRLVNDLVAHIGRKERWARQRRARRESNWCLATATRISAAVGLDAQCAAASWHAALPLCLAVFPFPRLLGLADTCSRTGDAARSVAMLPTLGLAHVERSGRVPRRWRADATNAIVEDSHLDRLDVGEWVLKLLLGRRD
eukprot:scaffold26186_cov30-Tisochrysis_lutea.AAC.2